MAYSIAYRSGGTHNCTWTRVAHTYGEHAAQEMVVDLERAGYKAIVDKNGFPHGLPIGWESKSPDYAFDEIQIVRADDGTMLQTIHRKKLVQNV